jgi:hypothetical protein
VCKGKIMSTVDEGEKDGSWVLLFAECSNKRKAERRIIRLYFSKQQKARPDPEHPPEHPSGKKQDLTLNIVNIWTHFFS